MTAEPNAPRRGVATVEELQAWQTRRTGAWSRLVAGATVVALTAVLARVAVLKGPPSEKLRTAAGSTYGTATEFAARGRLLDRRGRVLASSELGYRLFADPVEIAEHGDLDTVAVEVAHRIGVDPIEIDRPIQERSDRRYVRLVPQLADWQVDRLRADPVRGVGLEPIPVRRLNTAGLAAAVVGGVDIDHLGRSGAERRFEAMLRPVNGRRVALRDSDRRPLLVEPDDHQPGRDGADVHLSIDLAIQDIVERRLEQALVERNAGGVRAVVADARTGEILAMHDLIGPDRPGFDRKIEDPYRELDPALGRNRCVTDQYEPGSTFKPFVWAAATELGVIRPSDELPTPEHTGWRTPYGRLIRDDHFYGPSSWEKVLVKSMNSGMAMVAERLSHAQLRHAIASFGFGTSTRCGIPGEADGFVQGARAWSKYTQSSVAMGHEVAVTPVQMVRAFSVFCRDDGCMVSLRLTAAAPGEPDLPAGRAVLGSETAQQTRQIMRKVMEDGTGRKAESNLYRMFGKSGTAELVNDKGGGYHRDRYTSSFIAGAPLEHPRLIVLVVIDDPDRSRGDHKGGAAAGPVVRDIMDAALGYLGVHPDKAEAVDSGLEAGGWRLEAAAID